MKNYIALLLCLSITLVNVGLIITNLTLIELQKRVAILEHQK